MLPRVNGATFSPGAWDFLLFGSEESWASDACRSAEQVLEAVSMGTTVRCGVVELGAGGDELGGEEGVFEAYGVEMVPSLVAVGSGRGLMGCTDADAIVSFFGSECMNGRRGGEAAGCAPAAAPAAAAAAAPLEERLRQLIGRAPLMLFIKGSPEAPRCGFTGQLVRLLGAQGLRAGRDYEHFDILGDEEVRQGLKAHAQWPTYPQVYWRGELLGGLDIVQELAGTGELEGIVRAVQGQ